MYFSERVSSAMEKAIAGSASAPMIPHWSGRFPDASGLFFLRLCALSACRSSRSFRKYTPEAHRPKVMKARNVVSSAAGFRYECEASSGTVMRMFLAHWWSLISLMNAFFVDVAELIIFSALFCDCAFLMSEVGALTKMFLFAASHNGRSAVQSPA